MTYYLIGISLLVLLLVVVLKGFIQKRKTQIPHKRNFDFGDDLKSIGIEDIDMMVDGLEFEKYLHQLFLSLGYDDAHNTVASRDFGADIVFTDSTGNRTIIQAKRYSTEFHIGLDAVQQVYTAKNYYRAKKTAVITSTTFTDSSETIAGVNGVLLLDRSDLIEIIQSFQQGNNAKAKSIIEREPRVIYSHWDEESIKNKGSVIING